MLIHIEREGKEMQLSPSELQKLTGTFFIPHLEIPFPEEISHQCTKLYKKGKLTREQLWFGAYFKEEILSSRLPDVTLRWINSEIGWGIFARRGMKKMEFIAEYSGLLRRRKRDDRKNAYCFEYLIAPGEKTPFIIDAREQGGISRYINHSDQPNLTSALATFDSISHVILFAKRPIACGEQLTYDYGPDYWSCRKKPLFF